ncbi:MAG: TIGR04283 family arsenosugar biosynthesis glycosyltransferase [Gammaproteobacteria bacterium]
MISVIIPALNEATALPATLESLRQQAGAFETIVVDGGSSDETIAVAERFGDVSVISAPRGRAVQMNAGADIAAGDILLFLHADTLLPTGAIRSLNALESDQRCQAGGFRQRFSGRHWTLRFVSWLHNRRCALTGIFYGDQAMFVRRELFRELGGFPSGDMEDIAFSESVRKHCEPTFLNATVVTDSRKFERMGPLRSLFRCLTLLVCYELRMPLLGRAFFAPIR